MNLLFPMNLQNSTFEISASLMMNGIQERSFGPHCENWSDWNFKNLTEFALGNWNFNLKFQSYN